MTIQRHANPDKLTIYGQAYANGKILVNKYGRGFSYGK